MIYSIILAGGKGTRMNSPLPKCAYPLLKKPLISYILDSLSKSIVEKNIVVLGYKRELIEPIVTGNLISYQEQQLGTGDACKCAIPFLEEGISIILPGDTPLIDSSLIDEIITYHLNQKSLLTVGTQLMDNPTGFGRIIKNEQGIQAIIEEKDADFTVKQIKEINSGIMVCNNDVLKESLKLIDNKNAKGEYYLTDIVSMITKKGKVSSYLIKENKKLMGINDLYALSLVEKALREDINRKHMINGVNIINPDSTTIGPDVEINSGVTIYPSCLLMGKTKIFENAIIGPNTELENAVVNQSAKVTHSVISDSIIGEGSTVGPFVHLRMNTVIGTNNRIGNFVEMKKSSTKNKTHVVHLSYLGDTVCGEEVNFGCGVVTCNYDGKNKYQTKIGDHVFIGCNSNLIAPVEIEDNTYIAAGSTITQNVPKDTFAIARAKQVNKENYVNSLMEKISKAELNK